MPFVERRKNPHEYIDSCQSSIRSHFDERLDQLEKTIKSAVPDGDLDAHRRAHEQVIAAANDRATFWKTVREKTVSGVVLSAVMGIILAAWEYFKMKVRE